MKTVNSSQNLTTEELYAALEGLFYAVGEKGVTLPTISAVLNLETPIALRMLTRFMQHLLVDTSRGLMIIQVGESYRMVTKPQNYEYYTKLANRVLVQKFTQPALETLAIVAYRQPISRSQISVIRGVASDTIVERMVQKELLSEVGRAKTPGRPMLYETTEKFLEMFNLHTLRDLPQLQEKKSLNASENLENFELFDSMHEYEKTAELTLGLDALTDKDFDK